MPILVTDSKFIGLCMAIGFLWVIIVSIETFYFRGCSKRFLNGLISFWKILAITLIANIITILLITAITSAAFVFDWINYYSRELAFLLGFNLLLSVSIEWMIYIFFLRKLSIRSIDLFRISLVGNSLSFIPLYLFFIAMPYWRIVY